MTTASSTSFSDDVRDCAAAAEISEDVDDCQCRIIDDCVSDFNSVDCLLSDLPVDVEPCYSDNFDVAIADCSRAVVDVDLPETVSSSCPLSTDLAVESSVLTVDEAALDRELIETDSHSVVDPVVSQLRCD